MRLFVAAAFLSLACAASAAAQSGRRVKPAEPAAQPTPERQPAGQKDDAQKEGLLRLARRGEDPHAEPERDEAGNRVYMGRQVDRKARLLSKPEPGYPRSARRSRVEGTVVLRVVLGATGRVERIKVIKGLPEGVTEEAIKAARAIKFEPAEKDGRKVSQSVIVEYNFNVY